MNLSEILFDAEDDPVTVIMGLDFHWAEVFIYMMHIKRMTAPFKDFTLKQSAHSQKERKRWMRGIIC